MSKTISSNHLSTFLLITLIFWLKAFGAYGQLQIGDDPGLGVIQLKDDHMAQRISPDLLLVHDHWITQNPATNSNFQNPVKPAFIMDGMINIEAVSTYEDARFLVEELETIGLVTPTAFQRIVNGWLPITAIRQMASLNHLQFVTLAYRPHVRTGSVTSQGDSAQRSDNARMNFMVDGTGLTVGVLSDSHSDIPGGEAADIASGDLPAGGVNNLDNGPGMGTDEGRAMLQIVHDVAPGADLAFHTASGGLAVFASGIMDLQTAGCDVIVDDIGYPNDAFFQDGPVAQAADAVTAAGISYFSAAGNDAQQSYEGIFTNGGTLMVPTTPLPTSYTAHDFDPGPGVDVQQSITIPDDGFITLALNWENPFFSISGPPGASANLDLYLLNGAGTTIVAASTVNNINGNANEVIQFQNTTGAAANFNIFIGHATGTIPNRIKWIILGNLLSINEFDTQSATCFAHPNSTGAMATGASFWFNTPAFGTDPPLLNNFSSRGGTPILFDVMGNAIPPVNRNKPNFTAPDGGDNTFFGTDINDAGTFPNFFGTSAAAPHAAGVAALMLQLSTGLTPIQVSSTLANTAIDITHTGVGFDLDSGAGLINANAALTALLPLPVELAHFEAFAEGKTIMLKWQTASEIDNYGFEVEMAVERASNATALDWKFERFVPGAGSINGLRTYSEQFDNMAPGTYYFRLKQIDLDGDYNYSSVRTVLVRPNSLSLTAFFDPEQSKIIFSLTGNENSRIYLNLFDSVGKLLVHNSVLNFVDGTTELPVHYFPKGVFIYQLNIGKKQVVGKVVIH